MYRAIQLAHQENQKQVALINQMVSEIGKPKFDYPHADFNQELFDKIVADFMDEAKAAMDTDDKNVREARWNEMIQHWHEKYLEEYPDMDQYLEEITYKFQKKIRRGGRAAPCPRLRPVHPRPDAGAVRGDAGHPLRLPEAGYHLGGDGEAVYAPL